MSFDIFASGSGHYHFEKQQLPEGSDFDLFRAAGKLQHLELSVKGGLSAAADIFGPEATIIDMADDVAYLTFLGMLVNAVTHLSMHITEGGSSISVSPTNTHALWPDTGRFARYTFFPNEKPGTEFFQAISKALDETNMLNWGVLRALAVVIDDYTYTIENRKRQVNPMLLIQLTK